MPKTLVACQEGSSEARDSGSQRHQAEFRARAAQHVLPTLPPQLILFPLTIHKFSCDKPLASQGVIQSGPLPHLRPYSTLFNTDCLP